MIKSYVSTLLVLSVALAQATHAQDHGGQAPATDEAAMLSQLFDEGLSHYKAARYDEAIRVFDAMLAVDKYNTDAAAYRRRAAKRMGAKESRKQGASRLQAMAEIDAMWSPEPKFYGAVEKSDESVLSDADQQAIERMKSRLKAISIPSLDFNNANLEDVALFLAKASSRLGGVDGDVDFALVGLESAPDQIPVSLSIADMNLYEALQFVSDMTSLKFEVGPNVVSIMPANYVPPSEMVVRSYDIIPEVGADLESGADEGGGMGDLFGDTSSSEAAAGPVDVAKVFSIVDFPKGASALYQPRFHKLFVKNTPKNLKAVESVIADLSEQAIKRRNQQVEIEAKFVEFSEGALEELGFDWNVYGSGSAAGMEQDPRGVAPGPDLNTGQDILANGIAGDGRPGQNLFGSAQRSNQSAFGSIQSGLLGLMGGAPSTMVFGNGDIDMKISAMEQEGTADVLSAPRITTKSGSEATIRVAETHRYPQDYDVETGQRTIPIIKPQDWQDFDMGVSLKVTPEVDAENSMIDLELRPEILRFKGYDVYLAGYIAFDDGSNTTPGKSGYQGDLLAEMASFERRSVQTQVSVSDGHTLVMGGLIDERTETFRDQVPFLGDIPYLGRLFRTEGSRSAKKNLTIFVKASLVDAQGMTRSEREMSRQIAAD